MRERKKKNKSGFFLEQFSTKTPVHFPIFHCLVKDLFPLRMGEELPKDGFLEVRGKLSHDVQEAGLLALLLGLEKAVLGQVNEDQRLQHEIAHKLATVAKSYGNPKGRFLAKRE